MMAGLIQSELHLDDETLDRRQPMDFLARTGWTQAKLLKIDTACGYIARWTRRGYMVWIFADDGKHTAAVAHLEYGQPVEREHVNALDALTDLLESPEFRRLF
jgi:hypothetical protein